MLNNLRIRLQTDQPFRNQVVLGVFIVVMIIFLAFAYWLNFVQPNSTTTTNQTEQPTDTQEPQADPIRFDTSGGLEIALDVSGIANNRLRERNSQYYYINSNFQLGVDDKVYADVEIFPASMYATRTSVILNDLNQTIVFDKSSESFSEFSEGVYAVTPVENIQANITEYFFLDTSGFDGSIKRGFDLNSLTSAREYASFEIDSDLAYYELRSIGRNLYLVGYEELTGDGDVYIYSVQSNLIELVAAPANVTEIIFGPNHVVYETQALDGEYLQTAVDFSQDIGGNRLLLDVQNQLTEDGITGNLLLSRCTLSEFGFLNCLVKESTTDFTDPSANDVIARVDLTDGSYQRSFSNLFISAQSIYFTDSGVLHLVSQTDGKLYKFV
jgi:hypothetical protein